MQRAMGSITWLAALLLLTACGTPMDPPASPDSSTTAPSADPIELVDLWRVSGAEGEGPDTWLRLDAGQLTLWRDCGQFSGSWQAGPSAFLATVSGSSGGCAEAGSPPEVEWLESAWSYRSSGAGWELLASDGSVLAELTIDGAPEPVPHLAEEYAQPPEITAETQAAFAPPEPLPDGQEPARAEDLIGRWEPVSDYSTAPFISFAEDGTWSGSDGCNGLGGAWRLGDDVLLATAGPQTLIGCEGEILAVQGRMRASVDRELLTVYDAAGEVQFTVQRA